MDSKTLVSLNVGGQCFTTTLGTLTQGVAHNSWFSAVIPVHLEEQKQQGRSEAFFIDKDPKKFEILLEYLRDPNHFSVPSSVSDEFLESTAKDADYFMLPKELCRKLRKSWRFACQKPPCVERTPEENMLYHLSVTDENHRIRESMGKKARSSLESGTYELVLIDPAVKWNISGIFMTWKLKSPGRKPLRGHYGIHTDTNGFIRNITTGSVPLLLEAKSDVNVLCLDSKRRVVWTSHSIVTWRLHEGLNLKIPSIPIPECKRATFHSILFTIIPCAKGTCFSSLVDYDDNGFKLLPYQIVLSGTASFKW